MDMHLDAVASELHRQGYTIITSLFDACELDSLRKVCCDSFTESGCMHRIAFIGSFSN